MREREVMFSNDTNQPSVKKRGMANARQADYPISVIQFLCGGVCKLVD